MTRIHNAKSPIARLHDVRQSAFQRKPSGLWWSRDNGWHDLVRAGRSAGLRGRTIGVHDYEVHLGSDFRLLTLDSLSDITAFSRDYGQPMPHAPDGFFWQRAGTRDRYDPDQDPQMPGRMRAFLIDWPAVADTWDGIEVTCLGDGQKDRPCVDWLDTDWDIASGCAWRTGDVEITPVPAPCESPEP